MAMAMAMAMAKSFAFVLMAVLLHENWVIEAARLPAFDDLLQLFDSDTQLPSLDAPACGPQLSIETPACEVVDKRDGYELRKYPAGQIWVETLVANTSYLVATSVGFYRCFFYISGQNSESEQIEMTAPVHIQPAPEADGYKIAFFAPSRFKSVHDLPRPLDPNVRFSVPEASMYAVLGPFGGFPGESEYSKKWQKLKEALEKDKVTFHESTVLYAGYSSPFEIINRKQEVHVQVV
ncbi:hypothetical protein O6H91_03G058200 [Diphasiastrum complanatum]|uniref:Uncharacterized protein n=1 Tax=Diphasiastrum complanatum TaxID=34168 RepID=A0ACC2E726_DIPCM|nr:hypothetical protein O6H91_03G058200 [Diphasiastrum complanatum]